MKTTLIYPRFRYVNLGNEQDPLGILSIGTVLKNARYEVAFYDLTFAQSLDILKDDIRTSDLVGFSSTSPMFGIAEEVLSYAKRINPDIKAVIGGPHPTQDPQDALKGNFDFAVIGEGEQTILDLVKALEEGDYSQVKGIAYKEDGLTKINPPQLFIQDLDSLPIIERRLINYSKYYSFGMIASRGCPFNCFYCKPILDKLFGRSLRRRSIANVVEEMERLNRIDKNKVIYFRDDTFTINSAEWFRDFGQEIKKRRLTLKWGGNARVDTVDKEKLELMKESGCVGLSFGVESGSQRVIDFYRKGTKIEQVVEAFRLCRKLRIRPLAFIMLGAPIETRQDLEETYQLMRRIRPDLWNVFITTPFPGSYLYEYTKSRGILKVSNYLDYDNAQNMKFLNLPMELDYLTKDDLREYRDKINRYMIRRTFLSRLWGVLARPSELKKLVLQAPKAVNFLRTLISRY